MNWRCHPGDGRSPACPNAPTLLPFIHWLVAFVALSTLLGCTQQSTLLPPTLIPLAEAPELTGATPAPQIPPAAGSREAAPATAETPVAGTNPGDKGAAPSFVETGISPSQALQQFVPDAGPAGPADWRPPPYQVPLSLHPDDHYWLSRPIPSNRRNYDLEWYPFGNDVLLPELAPYRIHHGIDLPNPQGTSVLAAGSGTVIHAGPLPSPNDGVNYYGNTVIIHHDWQWQGQDVYTLYAHTLELFVEVGDTVDQGQLIAGVGSSGEVTSSHLHLEVRVGENTYADTRNPALWLAPYEGWGTLAGRLVDRRGRMIPGATLTLLPVNVDAPARIQRTYSLSVRSDDVWRENFVIGDLPVGRYTLLISVNAITYRRDVEVFPGQTTFEVVSTLFEYIPTATPVPSPTAVEGDTIEPTATPTP